MADLSIRKDFVDGTNELFTTLFNEGLKDGATLHQVLDLRKDSVYKEQKYKLYGNSKQLVCKANVSPIEGQTLDEQKFKGSFTVPLKCLQENGIEPTMENLRTLRKSAIIEFQGVFFSINSISPKAFIEDVFLFYQFDCTQDYGLSKDNIVVEQEEENE